MKVLRVPCAHAGSPIRTFCALAPLKAANNSYWDDINKQRLQLELIAPSLGIQDLSDWYHITRKRVVEHGGKTLFNYYSSLEQALRQIYPDYAWQSHLFPATRRVSKRSAENAMRPLPGHWQKRQNLVKAIENAEQLLGIRKPEDWLAVTMADLQAIGLPRQLTKPKLALLLRDRYPSHEWDRLYLLKGKYGQQKRLEQAVASLFPGVELKINVRKEADLVNPVTGYHLEIDVLVPSLKLAFEYQEKHHYTGTEYAYQPLEKIQARDKAKQELVAAKGITLITVPFWWDKRLQSLAATIRKARPDLLADREDLSDDEVAIPTEIPPDVMKQQLPNVEGIGQPTTACYFSLSQVDPTNWWLFEKYDGVRGFWNPEKKAFYSRSGRKIRLPQEIVNAMPDNIFLDGELWFGRNKFHEALQMVSGADITSSSLDWSQFKYMVFDVPNHGGTYQERYIELEKFVGEDGRVGKYITLAPRQVCTGIAHLEKVFQDVIDRGGEGVILRDPSAPYVQGRSTGYLKHKKYRDAEARVIGKSSPYEWQCILPNGVQFTAAAGTSEFVKRCNPKEGDIVTFKHRGFLVSGKPKLPSLYRLRDDISWDDVVTNWKDPKPSINSLPSLRRPAREAKRKGYWLDRENRRQFFLAIAAEKGFDPSDWLNWRQVTIKHVKEKKGAGLLALYRQSLTKALNDAFPEWFKATQ